MNWKKKVERRLEVLECNHRYAYSFYEDGTFIPRRKCCLCGKVEWVDPLKASELAKVFFDHQV